MKFEYALTNVGTAFNRAPYDKIWEDGETLALDSGGNYKGYIGDVCRMAYTKEPDSELVDLLGQVELVQQTARKTSRPARSGGDLRECQRGRAMLGQQQDVLLSTWHGHRQS
ncbi:M24 family metallopeptidase [Ochrobactrum pseudogrignonense]|nr:M24 family metallopeptidase [Brucella pseudogrignonensis]